MSEIEKGKYNKPMDMFAFLMECQPSYRLVDYIQLPLQFARELNREICELRMMFRANAERLKETQGNLDILRKEKESDDQAS